jgi:hypothetical protein
VSQGSLLTVFFSLVTVSVVELPSREWSLAVLVGVPCEMVKDCLITGQAFSLKGFAHLFNNDKVGDVAAKAVLSPTLVYQCTLTLLSDSVVCHGKQMEYKNTSTFDS